MLGTGLVITLATIFGFAVFSDVNVVHIEIHSVPPVMEAVGYDTEGVETVFLEELYLISRAAATARGTRFTALESIQTRSLRRFGDSLGIGDLVQNTQDLFGMIPYRLRGDIVHQDDKLHFRLEMVMQQHMTATPLLVETRRDFIKLSGPVQAKEELIHRMAEEVVHRADPYLLGLYYFRQELPGGDFTKTLPQLRYSLLIDTRDEPKWPLLLMGRIHNRKGEYDKAIAIFDFMEKAWPGFKFTSLRWGEALAKQGKYAEAAEKFLEAIKRDPDFSPPYMLWGNMLAEEGYPDVAEQLYKQALAILGTDLDHPDAAEVQYTVASFYARQNRPKDALPLIRTAVRLRPNQTEYRETLKSVLEQAFPIFVGNEIIGPSTSN